MVDSSPINTAVFTVVTSEPPSITVYSEDYCERGTYVYEVTAWQGTYTARAVSF